MSFYLTGIERFDNKLTAEQRVAGMTPCLIWTGTLSVVGYGVLGYQGRQWKAHRLAYTLTVAAVDPRLVIDHLCRVKSCVNPEHLEPVTSAENVMRGESPHARNARMTHCKRGHEFTPQNTRWKRHPNGAPFRACRECNRMRDRAEWKRKGAA